MNYRTKVSQQEAIRYVPFYGRKPKLTMTQQYLRQSA